jgi:hypothetical protein
VWIVALVLIFLIGLSRLYMGVHFPHDVILGWMFGGLILILSLYFWDTVEKWVRDIPLHEQVLLSLGFSCTMVLLGVGIVGGQGGWSMPQSWLALASRAPGEQLPNPISLERVLSASGALFGLLTGAAVTQKNGGFIADGSLIKRIARFLVGMIVLITIYAGLKVIFPVGDHLAAYFFRYLRYALIGLWISGGAPWVFRLMKLTGPSVVSNP